MIKSKPGATLGLCALAICWLTGCATPQPTEPEALAKPIEHPAPAQTLARDENIPQRIEAKPESTEGEVREINEEECVFFTLGSSTISHKEEYKIEAIAQKLHDDKSLVVTLIGHANDNGSPSFNLAVSDSRLATVAKRLLKLGVQRSQIRKEALGSERTPRNCSSSECRQKSRRVELIVTNGW